MSGSGANSPSSPTCSWVLLPEFSPLSTPSSPVKQSQKMSLQTQSLSQNWEWKQTPDDDTESEEAWTKTSVPTEIFKDLLNAGKIKDPFVDRNEESVQWVGETDWIYRTKFSMDRERREGERVILVFEGLDTFVDVFFNDKLILQSENMFHEHRVDVTDKIGEENILSLKFYSALNKGREEVKQKGDLKFWNGEASRLYVRKAQYHWGWDWGPTIMTCGPWKPIYLEIYRSRISDLDFSYTLSEDLTSAGVRYTITLESVPPDATVRVALYKPQKRGERKKDKTTLLYSETVPVSSTSASVSFSSSTTEITGDFTLENPKLWYPHNYGAQPLYDLTISLYHSDYLLDQKSHRLAIRSAKLIQRPLLDSEGTTFLFQINNIPIFCAGANWIPSHSLLTKTTPQTYRDWLTLFMKGGMTMLRVWGGGIYESTEFYSICDELGILVWQDFMFACGQYPCHPEFRKSVQREVECQLGRLKWFGCIVLYAGNNEDYQLAEAEGLEWDPEDKDEEKWLRGTFPARYLYERLLPDIVKRVVPGAGYHPGSPWGGTGSNDATVGDIHQWSVWHGSQLPYQSYPSLSGRFISEFGMQSLPHPRTLKSFITSPDEQYPQSRTMDHHNKAQGFERRLGSYILENYRLHDFSLGEWSKQSQRMQSNAMQCAFEGWRRLWRGQGREYCAGALVWQLNDCWGCTSWSIIDHSLRPKLAYYSIRRSLRPINISIERHLFPKSEYLAWPDRNPNDPDIKSDKVIWIDVWATNSTLRSVDLELKIQSFDITTGEMVDEFVEEVKVMGNGAEKVMSFNLSPRAPEIDPENIVVSAAFKEVRNTLGKSGNSDMVLRSAGDWPQPLKYLDFRERGIKFEVKGEEVSLSARLPTKSVVLDVEGDDDEGLEWSDNGFDVMPGERVKVIAKGLSGRKVIVSWYGDSQ